MAADKPVLGPDGLGGLLIVDKDGGLTSHDVVARGRKLLRTKKVGHAGTLDPMATGVLVLGVERATKLLGLLTLTTKAYTATIRLGQATTTDDAEGEIVSTTPAGAVTDTDITAGIAALTGEIQQIPATVSAIKVDGERAYARHRAGEEVKLAARPVTVHRFEVLARRTVADFVDLDVVVECSSGTYVRALARDLGVALGVGGHLTALRRTRVGPFTLDHARTLDQLADDPGLSLDIDAAVRTAFPHRTIDAAQAESLRDGRWLDPIGLAGVYVALTEDGTAIALLEEKGKRAAPVMVVRPRGLV
ncbi:tRNA pseudouridine(55) synthase TruB [Nocardia cyriacigeorgica]|uniref:tRNA pseudouridine(55) synthase TruB n=1 Tax=Nocardia cyriacigeorgica TaxID=135487 RepID=UPI001895307F|nr:tRNA pseudouridine(55) synthase TruB [Nocardia cyriacigeorgica]MBF6097126.1 tRNA pseudouridine(55) synthase TruB [Nocardia cyriacigeorgica]MBF6158600.1 tRNA pseudouridine(55) synthase TruB [Nocardia cyriacigeorgica]MBF6197712.1 tRNA pseudouridine(55) synthase TruB [Nocardia cyriacigeorgica]MBF6316577.1 tRNA pseudouridine(55) synthase TruB [Nocardia cyriacigeorgica]MBF6517705.1 tRNA pseudouridine(55) synthase TruB [Nocardia cyriacigeorgica]